MPVLAPPTTYDHNRMDTIDKIMTFGVAPVTMIGGILALGGLLYLIDSPSTVPTLEVDVPGLEQTR